MYVQHFHEIIVYETWEHLCDDFNLNGKVFYTNINIIH